MKIAMKHETLASAALATGVTLLMLLYVAAPYLAGLSNHVFCSRSVPSQYETQIEPPADRKLGEANLKLLFG